MSIWKEIRCDSIPDAENCFSKSNRGPKGFESIKEIERLAREEGWLIKADGAQCPACRKL